MVRQQVVQLSALIFSILLLVSGNAFLVTLLGVRLSLREAGPSLIGWILLCYSIGFVLGTIYADRIIQRVGHIRAFAVFAAATASTALLYPYLETPVLWALLRALSGLSMAGLLIVMESWFSSRATSDSRAALFAVYQIVFYIASASGQLLINVSDPLTFAPFTLAGILLTLALIPLSLTRVQAPPIEHVQPLPLRRLFRIAPLGMSASLISGLVLNAFYTMGPVYATSTGLSLDQVSIFMSVAVLAALVLAWPLGRVCDRIERRHVLMWLALIGGSCSLGVALLGQMSFIALLGLNSLFVGLGAAIYPVAVAIVNDRIDSHEIVAASAGLLLSYGIGACFGPALGSLLMTFVGPAGLFFVNAALLLVLVPMSRYWISHVEPVATQEHFVAAMASSTAAITAIDPRNEAFEEMTEPSAPPIDQAPLMDVTGTDGPRSS